MAGYKKFRRCKGLAILSAILASRCLIKFWTCHLVGEKNHATSEPGPLLKITQVRKGACLADAHILIFILVLLHLNERVFHQHLDVFWNS